MILYRCDMCAVANIQLSTQDMDARVLLLCHLSKYPACFSSSKLIGCYCRGDSSASLHVDVGNILMGKPEPRCICADTIGQLILQPDLLKRFSAFSLDDLIPPHSFLSLTLHPETMWSLQASNPFECLCVVLQALGLQPDCNTGADTSDLKAVVPQ